MLRNVLVPLDGSLASEAALPYAHAVAERTGGCLTLLRATSAPAGVGNSADRQAEAVQQAAQYLQGIAARLRSEGLAVDIAVPSGPPATSIAQEIGSRRIELVVMATHDPTGLRRWVRGSIAETVIRQVGIPVLLVCAFVGRVSADRFMAQQPVLVAPLDGSELAEAALPVARDLATALDGGVVLLAVVPHIGQPIPVRRGAPASLAEQDFREVQDEARAYLTVTAEQFGPGCDVATAVRTGDLGREINREAEERGAALIVMATHGRTGMRRSLLGSVAGQVVHSGSMPVLLIHPASSAAATRRIGWGMRLEDGVSTQGST